MRPRTYAIALTVLAIMITSSVAMACTETASAEITVKAVNEAGQTATVAVVTTSGSADKHSGPAATVKATVRAGATIGKAVWSTFSTVVATLARTVAHTVGEIT
jgi:hypothetical protein